MAHRDSAGVVKTTSNTSHTHSYAALDHDASHITSGSDVIDGDKLEVSWTPTNYTRTLVTDYSTSTSDLTSHLKGIDVAVGSPSIADNSITLAKLDHGTQGDIYYCDTGGAPSRLATGSAGQLLTSGGSGANPSWLPPMDVVGGRLDYVSTTQIKWSFLNSNQIRLFDGTQWRVVSATAEPTKAPTDTDMNGDVLAVDTIYDVFAKYTSATSFTLEFAKWAVYTEGASARHAAWVTSTAYKKGMRVSNGGSYYACILAHTSGASTAPGSGADWANCWLLLSGGNLHFLDGTMLYGSLATGTTNFDGRLYRFVGLVMPKSNSGVKFQSDAYEALVTSFYNQRLGTVVATNSTANWSYNVNSARELNNGTGMVRAKVLPCYTSPPMLVTLAVQVVMGEGGTGSAYLRAAYNSTSGSHPLLYTLAYVVSNQSTNAERSHTVQFIPGYNYATILECAPASPGSQTVYGTSTYTRLNIPILY